MADYRVDENLGGDAGLAQFRDKLKDHSIKLVLDFVPNHTAVEHPWVTTNPDFYINIPENGWQKRTFEMTQGASYQRKLLAACKRGGNIGVLLGPASGNLCTIDIDSDDEVETVPGVEPQAGKLAAHQWREWLPDLGQNRWRLSCPQNRLEIESPRNRQQEVCGRMARRWWVSISHPGKHPTTELCIGSLSRSWLSRLLSIIKWPESWGMIFKGDGARSKGGPLARQLARFHLNEWTAFGDTSKRSLRR